MNTKFLVVAENGNIPYCHFYAFCNGKLVFDCRGTTGRNGVSADRREGDGTTPLGTFKLGKCFGLLDVPEKISIDLGDGKETEIAMQKPYKVLDEHDYWNGDFYTAPFNDMVDDRDMPATWDKERGEHLIDYKVSYNYCAFIAFNKDYPRNESGSCIFLHCVNTGFSGTAGCIGIPEEYMLKALFLINDETTIEIIDDRSLDLRFKETTYKDAELIAPFFAKRANLSCDTTSFNMLFWSYYYGIRSYALGDEALLWLMETEMPNKELCAGFPVCEDSEAAEYVDIMYRYFEKCLGKKLVISCIDTELPAVLSVLEKHGDTAEITEYRDSADYIYYAENLRSLSGKKLHSKKNLCNSFEKTYKGRYYYRELNAGDADRLLDFLNEWRAERADDEQESLEYEIDGLIYAIKNYNFERLSVYMGGVFIDEKLSAFTLGSFCEKNKLAVIHFEKALSEYKGLYQFINREFLRTTMKNAVLVNREDDVGEEGLRKAKLSYQPFDFCRKYIIRAL